MIYVYLCNDYDMLVVTKIRSYFYNQFDLSYPTPHKHVQELCDNVCCVLMPVS